MNILNSLLVTEVSKGLILVILILVSVSSDPNTSMPASSRSILDSNESSNFKVDKNELIKECWL